MENVTDYKTALKDAARVAGNLAAMAESDCAAAEATIKVVGDGKKGAKIVSIDGLNVWLDAYIELLAGQEAKAAAVIKATLNTASKSWEVGTLGIQKIQGAYVFSLTPPKDDVVDPFADAMAALREVNKGLNATQQAEMLAMLAMVQAKFQ